MDCVWVSRAIAKVDPQALPLATAQGWARHPPVVNPGWVLGTGCDFNLLVGGNDVPLTQHPATGKATSPAPIEIADHGRGIKAVGTMVDVWPSNEAAVSRHAAGTIGCMAAVAAIR